MRDEILDVVAAKAYGQLADDDAAKHVMAEKAIASLRKRMTSVEEESAQERPARRCGQSARRPRGGAS